MKDQAAHVPVPAPTTVYAPPARTPRRRRTRETQQVEDLVRENQALRREIAKLEAFRTLAYRDAMTGLWNRRYFDERLAEELSRADRDRNRRFSILVADVNGLKAVNDSLGHAAGDRLIGAAARFLRQTLRTYDICCRVGGDEFAVIFPELGERECEALLTRVRRQLDKVNASRSQPLGLSFGCATFPTQETTLAALIAAADGAMYADKRRQKRRAEVGAGLRAAV